MTAKPTENESSSQYLLLLGAAVRQERKARGFSQEGFADHVHMDRSYMGGVERGERNLSFSNIMRILEGLEMEPGAFFSTHIHLLKKVVPGVIHGLDRLNESGGAHRERNAETGELARVTSKERG